MKKQIKVMLVEDNVEYREVVALALEDQSDLELIAHFGTAEIALRSLQANNQGAIPDVVLLDIRLPGMNGLDSLVWVQQYLPSAKAIMLTQSDDERDVLLAISRGAAGYLLKSSTAAQIAEAIRTVMQGGASLEAGVAKMVLDTLQGRLPPEKIETSAISDRELEVLTLLSEGLVKKQIAEQLSIGYSTVDTHVSHIYEKLQVSNAPAAVNRAHRMGLFSRESEK